METIPACFLAAPLPCPPCSDPPSQIWGLWSPPRTELGAQFSPETAAPRMGAWSFPDTKKRSKDPRVKDSSSPKLPSALRVQTLSQHEVTPRPPPSTSALPSSPLAWTPKGCIQRGRERPHPRTLPGSPLYRQRSLSSWLQPSASSGMPILQMRMSKCRVQCLYTARQPSLGLGFRMCHTAHGEELGQLLANSPSCTVW